MLTAENVKTLAPGFGADKCGIANTEQFADAPAGFRPQELYNKCRSVIVFLKQMPPEAILAETRRYAPQTLRSF